ncbi:MAG: hypothetical protein AAFN77_19340 [Planctomycetota bacterium]
MNDAVDYWTEKIKEAFLEDNLSLASSLADSALDETNSAPALMEIAGLIAFHQKDLGRAIQLIEAAMFETPLSITSQMALAEIRLEIKEPDSAFSILEFLVEIVERVPCSMLPKLTHMLAEVDRYEEAVAVCLEAHKRHPEDSNAIFGAGFYMHRAGHPLPLVAGAMVKAVEIRPRSFLYRLNLSVVLCWLEEWDQAYAHACCLSEKALGCIPCDCMAEQIKSLFERFEDTKRLEFLQSKNASELSDEHE